MLGTYLPLRAWAHAIYLTVSSSKGISTVTLSEMLDISYPSALHLGHRMNAMMVEANPFLAGVVGINEIYAGARPLKGATPYRDQDDADPPPANRKVVAALRGWIRTEVGRDLNVLITAKRPADLILERLNFQNPAPSSRLNRIIPKCGGAAVQARLADFQGRFGIISDEVIPACTSETCSCCGYVNKKNRPSQSTFQCLWCGNTMHADVNAARNIGVRRALSIGSVFQSKASTLAELAHQFRKRRVPGPRSGGRDSTADPRLHNPYVGGETPNAPRMPRQTRAPDLVRTIST